MRYKHHTALNDSRLEIFGLKKTYNIGGIAGIALSVQGHPCLEKTAGVALSQALDGDAEDTEEASMLWREYWIGAFVHSDCQNS